MPIKQINHITKQAYQGSNWGELERVQQGLGYKSNEWLTFVQARTNGLQVKKGSKGTHLFRIIEYIDKNSKGKDDVFHGKKSFTVFNMDQVEEVETNV